MNWKRVLPIALIAIVVIGAAAGIYIGLKPQKVGIAIHDMSDPVAKEYALVLQEELKAQGYVVTVEDAKNDQSLQNAQIEKWAKKKYAAVIVSPVMVSAASETVEIVNQANVTIIFIHKPVSFAALAAWDKVSYVGNTINVWGKCLGDAVLGLPNEGDINGDGVVSYLLVQDNPENIQKKGGTNALLQTLQTGEKAVKEIKQITTNAMESESSSLCAQAIAQYGKDIEVVICDSEASVLGAMQAIQEGGRVVGGDIYLVSTADTQQVFTEVAKGKITAVVHRDFGTLAQKTAEALKLFLNDQTTEQRYLIDCVTLTGENAVSYLTFAE